MQRKNPSIAVDSKRVIAHVWLQGLLYTEVSHSNGPFVFQPGHLILTNSFSKEVINPADISTPKIWDQSDNWFKSYGQKVNFLLTES